MKQALVSQRMDREQEDSHLEWPDHTDSSSQPFGLTRVTACLSNPSHTEILALGPQLPSLPLPCVDDEPGPFIGCAPGVECRCLSGTVLWMLTDRVLQSSSLLRAPTSQNTPAPVPGSVLEKLPRSASAASHFQFLPSATPSSVTAFLSCEPLIRSGSIG